MIFATFVSYLRFYFHSSLKHYSKSATRLFEVWCEVEPAKTGPAASNVLRCFPDTFRDEKVLNDIGEFAYPCEFEK